MGEYVTEREFNEMMFTHEDYNALKSDIAELEAQRNTFRNLAKLTDKKHTALEDGLRELRRIKSIGTADTIIAMGGSVVNADELDALTGGSDE